MSDRPIGVAVCDSFGWVGKIGICAVSVIARDGKEHPRERDRGALSAPGDHDRRPGGNGSGGLKDLFHRADRAVHLARELRGGGCRGGALAAALDER